MNACGSKLTFVDVAFNHDTHNSLLALLKLLRNDLCNLGLIAMVLLAVPVRTIDHESGGQALGLQLFLGLSDTLLVVVRPCGTAAQDDETVLVPDGAYDSDHAWLGDGKEMMGVTNGTDGVNGDTQGAICTVLEPDRERQAGR